MNPLSNHGSGSWGGLGAVAACARLLHLRPEQLGHALGLAEYHAPDASIMRSVAEPAINFTLNQGERGDSLGAFNHAGIQVASTDDVLAAKERLVSAGLAAFDEMDTTCCYARQDKIWVRDPDGTPWEVFATHEDTEFKGACCAA